MDRAQRVDEKSWTISLFIMFTPRIIVFKMPEVANFLYFSDNSKNFVSLGNIFKYTW